MSRGRLAIALAAGEREQLERVAAERELPPSRVAADWVSAELSRRLTMERARRATDPAHPQVADLAQIDRDIHAALMTPGVVGLLQDPQSYEPPEALQALNFLVDISAWLADPRPIMDRPRAPRLVGTPITVRRSGQLAAVLDRAGGADGRVLHAGGATGPAPTSDKQELLDVAPQGGAEDAGDDA